MADFQYCEVDLLDKATDSYMCRRCGAIYRGIKVLPLRAVCKARKQGATNTAPPPPKPAGGPGTELMAILSGMGINATESGCKCKSRAAAMDLYGVPWCRQNLDEIVSWLIEEAERRKWPMGRKWLRRGAQWAAKKLVLLAIQRAEEKIQQESAQKDSK